MPVSPKEKRKSAAAKSKVGKTRPVSERHVIHPEEKVELRLGDKALTVQETKDILGWTPEPEGESFGSDFLFKDMNGVKVRLANNVHNRPLYMSRVDDLVNEHLRRRWRFNGEPIIVSRTDQVLNGQHQGIAHVFAEQLREKEPDRYADWWTTPITMEKLIVYGVSDDDAVVNTMDTCKPRSLIDVIYRSPYFSTMSGRSRYEISRMLDYALKTVWYRTGYTNDPYAPRKTHSESLAFLECHKSLMECVDIIWRLNQVPKTEAGEDKVEASEPIGSLIGPGYAAALLYLFGACGTEPEDYRLVRDEKAIDWKYWEKAIEFWGLVAERDPKVAAIHRTLAKIINDYGKATLDEKLAVFTKGWLSFLLNGEVKAANIKPAYKFGETHGERYVDPIPDAGGIDLGDPEEDKKERLKAFLEAKRKAAAEENGQAVSAGTEAPDPTPEEIEEAARKEKERFVEDQKRKTEAKEKKRQEKLAAKRRVKNGHGEKDGEPAVEDDGPGPEPEDVVADDAAEDE